MAAGYAAALVMARPADIVNAIIGALIHARYELPVFATLERILHRVHALAHRNTTKSVFRRLRSKDRKALDQLLVIAVDQPRTTFEAIKKMPRRPSRKHLEDSVRHLEWLETLGGDGAALRGGADAGGRICQTNSHHGCRGTEAVHCAEAVHVVAVADSRH